MKFDQQNSGGNSWITIATAVLALIAGLFLLLPGVPEVPTAALTALGIGSCVFTVLAIVLIRRQRGARR